MEKINTVNYTVLAAAFILLILTQVQISTVNANVLTLNNALGIKSVSLSKDLKNLNLDHIKSTGHALAALFPVENIKTSQDALDIVISQGTPDYGSALGITFDDPVQSLDKLAKLYYALKPDIQKNDPATWQRYMNLATKPVGISCEYCCGVGPVGITKAGELSCGCKHNPAIHALTLWLMKNTEYSDAEILKEALKWKALWFPKNMVELALQVAGGDTSSLDNLPGMVGGC